MKISIITVAYNNIEGLKATSQSVLQQTSADIEWIVVDGASKDGSADFLKAFSGADIRWVSERDGGIFDAMNKGIGMASGRYSIFMNAGDVFAEENLIEKVVTAVGDSSPDLIYGDSLEQGGDELLYKAARDPKQISYVMFTHHQSIFYRTAAISDGYDLSYKYSGDWALTSTLLRKPGVTSLYCPFPICIFERGGISQREDQRKVIDHEHWRIYREIHRMNIVKSGVLWFTKTSANKFRSKFPGLYDTLRYRLKAR